MTECEALGPASAQTHKGAFPIDFGQARVFAQVGACEVHSGSEEPVNRAPSRWASVNRHRSRSRLEIAAGRPTGRCARWCR